jgi:D-ribose pyranose/furanose isomerase RbsD
MNPESFKSHLVFERLEQFRQTLNSEKITEKIGLESYTFFETGHRYIKDKINLTNPILVQEADLTNIASQIEECTIQINNFIGNNNVGHITNATNNLNSAITRIRHLPIPLSKNDFDFSKSVAQYQQTVQTAYESLKGQQEKLAKDLEEVQKNIESKQAVIKKLEQQLSEKQTEIQNVLIRYNNEFDTFKSSANNTVESDRKKFNENIETDRKSFKDSIDADRDIYTKAYENQKAYFDTEASNIISNLEQKLAEANKIVNIVGNVGVTGNYQKIANQHNKSANFFRWVALGFMIVMSGLLIYSIIELSNSDFNLYKSLVRILAAAVLTYPAIYAARESTRHRALETQNRNIELELASIGPFIELLPEDKKQSIKEGLVEKYFGKSHQTEGDKKPDADDVSISGLERVLKTILPYLKK